MVVYSAAILTKSKPLVARQFVALTRLRVEGLLSAFLRLVENGVNDHTFIETDSLRYVYQPMENMYLLLTTNKQSNILEDLQTLRLLGEVIQDVCDVTVSEELIRKNTFEIIFAFDEVISFGHRENVSLSQIKTYMEMDSHEDRLQTMIRQAKENEEKERRKHIAAKLDKDKARKRKENLKPSREHAFDPTDRVLDVPPHVPSEEPPAVHHSNVNNFAPKSGMHIGKKKYDPTIYDSLKRPATEPSSQNVDLDKIPNKPITVTIEEKITGSLRTDGEAQEIDIQGTFQICVHDVALGSLAAFRCQEEDSRFKYRVHPNLNKASHSRNLLELKDESKAFRANTPAPLLRWRYQGKDEALLPFVPNCWLATTDSTTNLTVELEISNPSEFTLENVELQFGCPQDFSPEILTLEGGETNYDGVTLHWVIAKMDEYLPACTLEFAVKADCSMLLPFTLEALSRKLACRFSVLSCYDQKSGETIEYEGETVALYNLQIG